jgi:hypothetical protein
VAEPHALFSNQEQPMIYRHSQLVCLSCCLFLLAVAQQSVAQPDEEKKIESAVANLRNSNFATIPDAQREAKGKQLDEVWTLLRGSGPKGLARLKQEIQKVDAGKEKDNFFMLSASALLWHLGKTTEAPSIARIWGSTPLADHYNYVFDTAVEAAQTQASAVVPGR